MKKTKISEKMTPAQRKKVHSIIHASSASAAAVGGGLANIPGSDSPVLIAIQTGMIISIGAVFKQKLTESISKTLLADFLGATIGKTIANVLTGWIPGVGNGINAATAASITELIGWTIANDFANDTITLDNETKEAVELIINRTTDYYNDPQNKKRIEEDKKKIKKEKRKKERIKKLNKIAKSINSNKFNSIKSIIFTFTT